MKQFQIKNNDISDGYHTFDELYEHRVLLWINLCLANAGHVNSSYFVKEHFAGWDLLVMTDASGDQLSYHVPISKRRLYENKIKVIDIDNHEFDGHTSENVLERLSRLADKSRF